MKKPENYCKYLLSVLFLLFIFLGMWLDLPNIKSSVRHSLEEAKGLPLKEAAASFEAELNDSFFCKLQAVDVDGLFRRGLGQKMVRGTVLDGNGQLHGAGNLSRKYGQWDRNTEDRGIAYVERLLEESKKTGAAVLFVQTPVKCVPEITPVPYDFHSVEWEITDYWLERLRSSGTAPILDLRDPAYGADAFYNTDHHWTIESAFAASRAILEAVDQQVPLEGLDIVTDPDNYDIDAYKNAMLGSAGVRTGKYFAGKDDMNILIPHYPMDIEFTAFDNDHTVLDAHSGDFREAFLDRTILEDPGYYNKYGALLYGACIENVIRNSRAFNDEKVLLTGNSFTRPLACYLSASFSELRTLDIQTVRYHQDAAAYIRDYEPDVVIVAYSAGYSQMG